MLRISDVIDEWLQSQRVYMYLAPIFSKDEFVIALSSDARKYVKNE